MKEKINWQKELLKRQIKCNPQSKCLRRKSGRSKKNYPLFKNI